MLPYPYFTVHNRKQTLSAACFLANITNAKQYHPLYLLLLYMLFLFSVPCIIFNYAHRVYVKDVWNFILNSAQIFSSIQALPSLRISD